MECRRPKNRNFRGGAGFVALNTGVGFFSGANTRGADILCQSKWGASTTGQGGLAELAPPEKMKYAVGGRSYTTPGIGHSIPRSAGQMIPLTVCCTNHRLPFDPTGGGTQGGLVELAPPEKTKYAVGWRSYTTPGIGHSIPRGAGQMIRFMVDQGGGTNRL